MRSQSNTFKPGHFSPVVEVSVRDSGLPAPAETDFDSLETVSKVTLDVVSASARGFGSLLPSTVPNSSIGKVIGLLLACKNIVEQLSFLSVYARVSGPLRQSPETLEPIVRFYTYLGHFEHDGKTYVSRGLEELLVRYLFQLRRWASDRLCTLEKNVIATTQAEFDAIDLRFYRLLPDGNIGFSKTKRFKDYLRELLKTFIESSDLDCDDVFPVTRMILDTSTEDGLRQVLRFLRYEYPSVRIPERNFEDEPTREHQAAMTKLFGAPYSSDDDVIPNARFSESISRSFSLLRSITAERSYVVKTIPFPRYEGGSAAQLAVLSDDVIHSDIPLSLDASTVAAAVKLSYGSSARFRAAAGIDPDETLRSLVSQSIIKK